MIMLKISNVLTFAVVIVMTTGCVSVGVKPTKVTKSEGVKFEAPGAPYISFEQQALDAAWKNPKLGTTISYLSECGSGSDPSHQVIRDGIVASVSEIQIHKEEMVDFNQRKALSSRISGLVDGIPTTFQLYILKKNSCLYVITYAALSEDFESDYEHFVKFISRFKAP